MITNDFIFDDTFLIILDIFYTSTFSSLPHGIRIRMTHISIIEVKWLTFMSKLKCNTAIRQDSIFLTFSFYNLYFKTIQNEKSVYSYRYTHIAISYNQKYQWRRGSRKILLLSCPNIALVRYLVLLGYSINCCLRSKWRIS